MDFCGSLTLEMLQLPFCRCFTVVVGRLAFSVWQIANSPYCDRSYRPKTIDI